jgi:hypothetical protein
MQARSGDSKAVFGTYGISVLALPQEESQPP